MTNHRAYYNFRHARKAAFINEYRHTGNILLAAQAARVARNTVYYWQEHDERFVMAVHLAEAEAVERLEEEARRRAVDGVKREKGVYWQGSLVGTEVITEYSDSLLTLLLRARKPERYKERIAVETQPPVKAYAGVDVEQV